MTTVRRMGVAGLAVVVLGTCAVYYATTLVACRPDLPDARLGYIVPSLAGSLVILVLLVFRRNVCRATARIASQLRHMARSEQIGLVLVDEAEDLSLVTRPLNEFLTAVKKQLEQLRSENRDLQIQARVASAEKHNTEAIIFSISDAVIVTNRFDELVLANEAAERLLGFRLSSAQRKTLDRIIADASLVKMIRETRSQGPSSGRRVLDHTVDQKGSPRTFSITLSCVVTPGEEVSGVVAVLHDVTREKEIAKLKTDFVSNVSHELKTPLASIKAYVEMLIDGEAEDDRTRREFYDIIAAETDRLHRLIENILNISRIESGVVKVVREPNSLTAIAKQVLDVAAPQARLKDVKLVERLSPVYYQVEADHDMLYQAVMNLLSNAIKYTPGGGTVTVSVGVDERRGLAFCEVVDTGVGIPADELPHIFDKFYRVRATSKLAKGTGLGLTLAKHIIETVHDGKLTVSSQEGKGSTFRFELPTLQ